jgi:hypothetical protein
MVKSAGLARMKGWPDLTFAVTHTCPNCSGQQTLVRVKMDWDDIAEWVTKLALEASSAQKKIVQKPKSRPSKKGPPKPAAPPAPPMANKPLTNWITDDLGESTRILQAERMEVMNCEPVFSDPEGKGERCILLQFASGSELESPRSLGLRDAQILFKSLACSLAEHEDSVARDVVASHFRQGHED